MLFIHITEGSTKTALKTREIKKPPSQYPVDLEPIFGAKYMIEAHIIRKRSIVLSANEESINSL
jgi:hypothetical protein